MRRGSDIVKALALGAQATLVGRAPLYGVACDGEQGALSVLQLLAQETERTMTLAGRHARARTGAAPRRPARCAFAHRTGRWRAANQGNPARETLHLPGARDCLG
jgi:hypothetical protein